MRHIKNYNELFEAQMELSQEQIEWLDKCTRGKWTLNPQTGLVDVKGDFYCVEEGLTDFKGVRFGVVAGTFDCRYNLLTSLEGAPRDVGGRFSCYHNRLTSLEGAPQEVGRSFYCSHNRLTSLEGAPQEVGSDFFCDYNSLTSLEGAPQKVGENFWCDHNLLTSLEGAPQKVGENLYFMDNPVSQGTLGDLYKRMKSGMAWDEAVEMHWDYMDEDDRTLLAQYNPKLSPEDVKGYQALAKFRNKII
jgi:hypothetical protein